MAYLGSREVFFIFCSVEVNSVPLLTRAATSQSLIQRDVFF